MLGHVFRKEGEIVKGTPGWQENGRRGRGRPRETWVRTMKREMGEECLANLEEIGQDRCWWRDSSRPFASPWLPQELID